MNKVILKGKDWVKVFVNTKVYSMNTIYSAAYIFLDKAYFYLDGNNRNAVYVWLFPKNKEDDLVLLAKDFLNELINYANYYSNLKVNAEAVKLLMQRALFSVTPSLAKEAEEKEIEDLIKELEDEEKKSEKKK